ncbi:hypothetical protein QBC39DRAFT_356038 [Podospora conica]|nr:hypothetical protein QBC39DRAFT_356038 [Schizothecium conicum]
MATPRRSAWEDLMQIRASVMNTPQSSTPQTNTPQISIHQTNTPPIGLMVSEPAVFSPAKSDANLALNYLPFGNSVPSQSRTDLDYQQFPVTVAPSDLTTSPYKHSFVDLTEPEDNHGILGGILDENEQEAEVMSDVPEDLITQNVFDVTLPLASATRDMYLRVLAENKQTMVEFGSAFNSLPRVPDADLVARMDAVFQKLRDFCDLPPYAGDLHSLHQDDIVKYATSTNSKFVFIHVLLQALRGSPGMRVLIISQPGRVFEYLEATVATSTANYTVMSRSGVTEHTGLDADPTVILADTEGNLAQVRTVDVVVKFDGAARSVKVPRSLAFPDGTPPMTLMLISTHTLEHIDLDLGDDLQGLERKNALNVVSVLAKELLRSPQDGYPEPHQAAELFAAFLKDPENTDIDWQPQRIPDKYLHVWASSQSTQLESIQSGNAPRSESLAAGRKRSHDDDDEESSKKMRLLDLRQAAPGWETVPMSDLLRSTLAKYKSPSNLQTRSVNVPVAQLEAIALEILTLKENNSSSAETEALFREHIVTLEKQVRSYEKSLKTIQPRYQEAIGDRGVFEDKFKKATLEAKAAESRCQELQSELKTANEQAAMLKTDLAESKAIQLGSSNPDIAKAARLEKELEEANAKIQTLEKRLVSASNEMEYSRTAYQDASSSFGRINQENQELKARLAELEYKASDNIRNIHKMNDKTLEDSEERQLSEFHAIIRERERELAVAREELRLLKNGRRETRQGSVPRSPRTSLMSPRPGRAATGAGSRGTSPAPAYETQGIAQPPSNARWQHLRD